MDPDQGREDIFRQLVYTPAELEKGELDHKQDEMWRVNEEFGPNKVNEKTNQGNQVT